MKRSIAFALAAATALALALVLNIGLLAGFPWSEGIR